MPTRKKTKTTKAEPRRFVTFFQLLQYRAAVRCEAAGMKHSSGRSVTALVKRTFQIKGTQEEIISHLTLLIKKMKENNY